ncbi:MAG: gluconeogenesis factor YvcK family protein [Nitriliruptoraceae bacterium]
MRAVAIGGGHGASRTLAALRTLTDEVTAIVTVADDGGSSGRLRRELGVVPPGDLRMAIAALAPDEPWTDLIGHRFSGGQLAGHSLGNLLLVALIERYDGNVVAALDELCRLLGATGRVLPCTATPVTLHATGATGQIDGQAAIAATARLDRVWLEPDAPPATPEAQDALADADLVVIGPGSLYTSLLPNLLVPGITAALQNSRAVTVFVANLREQLGETEGMTLGDHLAAIREHVGDVGIDVIVVHDGPIADGHPIAVDQDMRDVDAQIVTADVWKRDDPHGGHDPGILAGVLRRMTNRIDHDR